MIVDKCQHSNFFVVEKLFRKKVNFPVTNRSWNTNKCTGHVYHAISISSREKITLQIKGKDTSEKESVAITT